MIVEIFISYNKANKPTAIDVYRGKTTLEITYIDSIPVDSTVVFKDKNKMNYDYKGDSNN